MREEDILSRAVRMPVAEKREPEGQPCLCSEDCPQKVKGYFARGHVARYRAKMRRIAKGESTPIAEFGRSLAMRLGPWTTNFRGGKFPAKTFEDLR
jgi:hypothetical protein